MSTICPGCPTGGRLRAVHTNTVFWGWTSLAMIALSLYVVPKTSQRRLYSFPLAWASLILMNLAVLVGGLCLMAGINNGGQEYREYIWRSRARLPPASSWRTSRSCAILERRAGRGRRCPDALDVDQGATVTPAARITLCAR